MKLEARKWYETDHGDRVYIIGRVPDCDHGYAFVMVGMNKNMDLKTYKEDGQWSAFPNPARDLVRELVGCDSWDWDEDSYEEEQHTCPAVDVQIDFEIIADGAQLLDVDEWYDTVDQNWAPVTSCNPQLKKVARDCFVYRRPVNEPYPKYWTVPGATLTAYCVQDAPDLRIIPIAVDGKSYLIDGFDGPGGHWRRCTKDEALARLKVSPQEKAEWSSNVSDDDEHDCPDDCTCCDDEVDDDFREEEFDLNSGDKIEIHTGESQAVNLTINIHNYHPLSVPCDDPAVPDPNCENCCV